jgi:hypothetical protein
MLPCDLKINEKFYENENENENYIFNNENNENEIGNLYDEIRSDSTKCENNIYNNNINLNENLNTNKSGNFTPKKNRKK